MEPLPDFSIGILRGLWHAIRTDINVFLIALAGLLLGGRRGLGKALLFYVTLRRADDYATVWVNETRRTAQVMGANAGPKND